MTNLTRYVTTQLVAEECYSCHVTFGLGDGMRSSLISTGATFYCPNGHGQHFTETDTQRLRKAKQREESLRAQLTHTRDQRDAAERSASAHKGVATRVKNRVAKGVCPCCNRTFQNLAGHMAGQHPGFGDS